VDASREAVSREAAKIPSTPTVSRRQPLLDSGLCLYRRPEAPDTKGSKTGMTPSSASAGQRHVCWSTSQAPDPTKTRSQPSSAIAGQRHVQVERPKKSRQRQQPAYQLAREQLGEHRGAGLCLAVIEGRAHKYSANAIYRSIRTDTSIVASMGQIGHDCHEGCRAQAEPNRYLCRLARHELRVSFD
jgi:hypothetical protein